MLKKATKTVLATFASKSSNKMHEVRLGKDGVIYCTCSGWRFYRHCWHLTTVMATVAQVFKRAA